MKNKLINLFLVGLLVQCSNVQNSENKEVISELNKQIPKVLILTTGISDKNKELPEGISVAIQSFNKRGVFVQLEPRNILFDYEKLSEYNIIIASTSENYHDADRDYSLTYLSDFELQNIENFVRNGGVLISGDNFGRNYIDGTDRVSVFKTLNKDNWNLSKCFGVTMTEKNMAKYSIVSDKNNTLNISNGKIDTSDFWVLAIDSVISTSVKKLAYWKKESDSIPAIIQNKYEKGFAYQLAYSDFLHPISQDGKWSISQIDNFYGFVLEEFYKENDFDIQLNSWKNGHEFAFCVSFNSSGKEEEYKRIVDYLKTENIQPTFFVDGYLNDTIKEYLKSNNLNIQSSGFNYIDFSQSKFSISSSDILQNENEWDLKFKGFRFPYFSEGYWGLLVLDKHNYLFESSISSNNVDEVNGSFFPYNLVISKDDFYKSTNILELSPSYKNDYHYLEAVKNKTEINQNELNKKVLLYSDFLQTYWDLGVKKQGGLFVYIGHPDLVGHNETTLSALENLVDSVQSENTWIASMNEIATFRKELSQFSYFVTKKRKKYSISVKGAKGIICKKTAINLKFKPESVKANSGEVTVIETKNGYSVVFDSFDRQVVTLKK